MNEIQIVQVCENCDPFWQEKQMSEEEFSDFLNESQRIVEFYDNLPLDPAVIPSYDEHGNEILYKGN